jgi:hypothetical protein
MLFFLILISRSVITTAQLIYPAGALTGLI